MHLAYRQTDTNCSFQRHWFGTTSSSWLPPCAQCTCPGWLAEVLMSQKSSSTHSTDCIWTAVASSTLSLAIIITSPLVQLHIIEPKSWSPNIPVLDKFWWSRNSVPIQLLPKYGQLENCVCIFQIKIFSKYQEDFNTPSRNASYRKWFQFKLITSEENSTSSKKSKENGR